MLTRFLIRMVSTLAIAAVPSMPVTFAMGTSPQSGARLGSGQIVATAGIRGLDEERLKAARFDAPELARLESHAVSAGAARNFAAQAGLHSRAIAYLPDPTRPSAAQP